MTYNSEKRQQGQKNKTKPHQLFTLSGAGGEEGWLISQDRVSNFIILHLKRNIHRKKIKNPDVTCSRRSNWNMGQYKGHL